MCMLLKYFFFVFAQKEKKHVSVTQLQTVELLKLQNRTFLTCQKSI